MSGLRPFGRRLPQIAGSAAVIDGGVLADRELPMIGTGGRVDHSAVASARIVFLAPSERWPDLVCI